MDDLKLFIKKQKEECLFCVYCGHQTLHMDADNLNHFSCVDCSCDIYMYSEERW
jgi:hypothetical protein